MCHNILDFIHFHSSCVENQSSKMYLWETNFTVKVLFSCSNFFFVFFVLTKVFVQCNSHFCKTKLDSFYNTLDLCYFHKVSLICSADNIYIYEKSDHNSLHIYIYIYMYIYIVLVMYPEIFKDNACIRNHSV